MLNSNVLPSFDDYYKNLLDNTDKSNSRKFTNIFETMLNLLEISLQIFIIVTIRTYEQIISDEENILLKKKVDPIKTMLQKKFTAPSLGSYIELARNCFHLINEDCPKQLMDFKNKLDENISLNEIAIFLNDIEKIFEIVSEKNVNIPVISPKSKLPFLKSLLPKFITFRNINAHIENIENIIEENEKKLNLDLKIWDNALKLLFSHLHPFLNVKYRIIKPNKITNVNVEDKIGSISIDITEYANCKKTLTKGFISAKEWSKNPRDLGIEIALEDTDSDKVIDVSPFISFSEENLFFYKKTVSKGFLYYSFINKKSLTNSTKRKFNYATLRNLYRGREQSLFWTEVKPLLNSSKTIKANIPTEGNLNFIGRKKQINSITEEIIEIPNQNGLIYGPGGVGKTSLMIEITNLMFKEDNNTNILFDNIIWVMAKLNYYDPILNAIHTKESKLNSLDNIFEAILRFFEIEDAEEYEFEDKKELVLEILKENKVLLILDNFETFKQEEVPSLIKFFETEVKKHLKLLPNNFKVIITSRELIPSGFHQFKLKGLDLREAKILIKKLYEQYYKDSNRSKLTDDQMYLVHDNSFGIPIVIKHCIGQLYEFNIPFEKVLRNLGDSSNEVIKFSYKEIFTLMNKDETYKKIIILLEINKEPLSIRQIHEILEISENLIYEKIPHLLNYQCVDKINIDMNEKYFIYPETSLFSKTLLKDNRDLAKEIKNLLIKNFTFIRRSDYSKEELNLVDIFKEYISNKSLVYAEEFIKNEIVKNPHSIILKLNYAGFMKDIQKDVNTAINYLELLNSEIFLKGKTDIQVIKMLAECHSLTEPPNYEKSFIYYNELLNCSKEEEILLEVATFYITWSKFLRTKKYGDDFLKEIENKTKYKELAKEGIELIMLIPKEKFTHKEYYLLSRAYFNLWKNDAAKINIEKAIKLTPVNNEELKFYNKFKRDIIRKVQKYS